MKGNYDSFLEFAREIERVEAEHEDYIVPTRVLRMLTPNQVEVPINGGGYRWFTVNRFASGQIAARAGIPWKWYEKMADYPGLREHTVNTVWQAEPMRRLIRTDRDVIRAFLSDSYQPQLSNAFLMSALLPTFREFPDLQFKSHSLTDERLYLQVVFPRLQGEVKVGDVVQGGITITNSEVGAGAVNVEMLLWRLTCSNGMILKSLLRKTHVGRRIQEDVDGRIYQDDTIRADQEAYRLRLRDVVANALDETRFQGLMTMLRDATEDRIEDAEQVVQNVTKRFALPEAMHAPMLMDMAAGGNVNRYGLANSITAYAQTIEDRDAQYHLERVGAKVIEMSSTEWRQVVA